MGSLFLRWRQISHSGSGFDNWGLDNVELADLSTNFAPYGEDASFSLAENSPNNTVIGMVMADDPNPNQNLTYSILSGNDAGGFAIASNGELTVADSTVLDYEANPSFSLEIEVADDGTPSLSNTMAIEIDLINIFDRKTTSLLLHLNFLL